MVIDLASYLMLPGSLDMKWCLQIIHDGIYSHVVIQLWVVKANFSGDLYVIYCLMNINTHGRVVKA